MAHHLIRTITAATLHEAAADLGAAHAFIAVRARAALADVPGVGPQWGAEMKRLAVDLDGPDRPALLGKRREGLAEVVNMLATAERLISALRWFGVHPEFAGLRVAVCHPSTSSHAGENDVVLVDASGAVRVRCEVCDVASASAGQNGKERSDLKNLGCAEGVPADGVRRFIATAPEFAAALRGERRKWTGVKHRYRAHHTGGPTETVLLEVVSISEASESSV